MLMHTKRLILLLALIVVGGVALAAQQPTVPKHRLELMAVDVVSVPGTRIQGPRSDLIAETPGVVVIWTQLATSAAAAQALEYVLWIDGAIAVPLGGVTCAEPATSNGYPCRARIQMFTPPTAPANVLSIP